MLSSLLSLQPHPAPTRPRQSSTEASVWYVLEIPPLPTTLFPRSQQNYMGHQKNDNRKKISSSLMNDEYELNSLKNNIKNFFDFQLKEYPNLKAN